MIILYHMNWTSNHVRIAYIFLSIGFKFFKTKCHQRKPLLQKPLLQKHLHQKHLLLKNNQLKKLKLKMNSLKFYQKMN